MVAVSDIVQYFLHQASEDDDTAISNLKLQKLLYYAQAFHLAIFDQAFFEDDFYAWMHGPVCPAIYHQYKQFGANPIPFDPDVALPAFSKEQLELLEEINQQYGQFSAWKLRNMTHEEAPWKAMEATGGLISKASMQEFYKTRLK